MIEREGVSFLHNLGITIRPTCPTDEHAPVEVVFCYSKNPKRAKLEEGNMLTYPCQAFREMEPWEILFLTQYRKQQALKCQEAEFCRRMAEQMFDPVNRYFTAVNLSLDPSHHDYGQAILVGWFCLHGGLHALLKEFPILREHYKKQGHIPIHPEAYVLLQFFIAWRHAGDYDYVTGRMDWFRRRFFSLSNTDFHLHLSR